MAANGAYVIKSRSFLVRLTTSKIIRKFFAGFVISKNNPGSDYPKRVLIV